MRSRGEIIERKTIVGIICAIGAIVAIAVMFLKPPPAEIPLVTSKTALVEPTIDGQVKINEWVDAKKLDISAEGYEAYFYVKHDNSSLYLAWDISGENPPDGVGVDFDWKNDKNLDGLHDTEYILTKGWTFEGYRLKFEEGTVHSYIFENCQAEGEFTLENEYSHFEIKAPLEEMYLSENDRVGLYVELTRSEPADNKPPTLHTLIDWPQASDPIHPGTWADLWIKS